MSDNHLEDALVAIRRVMRATEIRWYQQLFLIFARCVVAQFLRIPWRKKRQLQQTQMVRPILTYKGLSE